MLNSSILAATTTIVSIAAVNQIEYSIMIEPLNSNAKEASLEEVDATLAKLALTRIIQVILRCVAANHA